MAIDLNSYYNYLNNLSVNTKNLIGSGYGTQGITSSNTFDNETSSEFEMALLSMIDQSSTAYDKISEYANQNSDFSSNIGSSTTSDAQELYDQLSTILESYNQLKSDSSSISNTLLSSLSNKDSNTSESSSNILSDLNLLNTVNNTSTE